MASPTLRHRRDRQRELALQEPRLAFPRSPRLRNPDSAPGRALRPQRNMGVGENLGW